MPRILFLDIETAPNLATVWSIWNQNIGINQLLESSYVLCWAAKWKDTERVLFDSVQKSGKTGVVKNIWDLLNEADIVVHYNGRKFDIPTLNKEFLLMKLPPPAPYKQVDLYQEVKHKFMFVSNKLDYVAKAMGFPGKIKTDHQLWLDCMNGKAAAWSFMRKYNMKDVEELEKVYNRLVGWLERHPNMGLWGSMHGETCPNCGSKRVQARGYRKCLTRTYRRFQCQECGAWSRAQKSEPSEKRPMLIKIPTE